MAATGPRAELRGAVYRGDVATIVAILRKYPPADWLQLGGDGLLLALDQDSPGAVETARAWVDELRERDWDGDHELADQLAARLGIGAAPLLRPLPVDLDALSGVLEGDPREGGGAIDLRTGEVWPQFVLDDGLEFSDEDDEDDEDDDEDLWLEVETQGSRSGYRDMERFVDTIDDPDRRDRLEIALQGRGAFRRFKDVLARWPAELTRRHAFSDERERGRARAWLADAGYRPAARGTQPLP